MRATGGPEEDDLLLIKEVRSVTLGPFGEPPFSVYTPWEDSDPKEIQKFNVWITCDLEVIK